MVVYVIILYNTMVPAGGMAYIFIYFIVIFVIYALFTFILFQSVVVNRWLAQRFFFSFVIVISLPSESKSQVISL